MLNWEEHSPILFYPFGIISPLVDFWYSGSSGGLLVFWVLRRTFGILGPPEDFWYSGSSGGLLVLWVLQRTFGILGPPEDFWYSGSAGEPTLLRRTQKTKILSYPIHYICISRRFFKRLKRRIKCRRKIKNRRLRGQF